MREPFPLVLSLHLAATAMALCTASPALAQNATPAWRSGFETGFPGEWLDYDGGAYTATERPTRA